MAVEDEEIPRLQNLYERGQENGAKDLKLLDRHEIKDVEPNCEVSKSLFVCLIVYLFFRLFLFICWKFVCLFTFLFVCFFVCFLFVCLLACLVGWLTQ